ncbi:diguanylate cyclase domain-containing protein [Ancylobacter moscoviensis]
MRTGITVGQGPLLTQDAAGETSDVAGYDALCRVARALLGVHAASVVLARNAGHWIDADPRAVPRDWIFPKTIEEFGGLGEDLKAITDFSSDTADTESAWTRRMPGLRFFASIPLGSSAEGRLCLFDTRPRTIEDTGDDHLRDLGRIAHEILRLHRELQAAKQQEADFRLLAESSTDTIVRGDLEGVRLYVSPSVNTLLGYEPEELIGRQAADIVHPDDAPRFREMMQRIREGNFDVGESEIRQRHKNGSWVWMEASIRLTYDRTTGEPNGYVASVRGMDRRKKLEARLTRQATHDVLTGLANRALLEEHLNEAVARNRSTGQRFALFYLDVDHFKRVNDTLGHQAGDAVLREVAIRLRGGMRPQDIVARVGGDEFAALLEVSTNPREVDRVAERLIRALGVPVEYGGHSISLGISIGIARVPECGLAPAALQAAADGALYEAKQAGRGCYRYAACRPNENGSAQG